MFSIDESQLFLGCPIPFKDICLVYPLTIKDIAVMGENKYRFLLNLLTMSQEEILNIFEERKVEPPESLNVFEYLLASCAHDVNFLLDIKKAFFTFIREQVQISLEEGMIIVGDLKDKRIINKENFCEFQNILREQNKIPIPEEIPEHENEMQKKFRLKRLALKKAKKKQALKNEEEIISLKTMMCAFLVFNLGTWEEMQNLSLYTFYSLLDMAREKEKYEQDIGSILAGADPKKIKLKYWIRNIIKED